MHPAVEHARLHARRVHLERDELDQAVVDEDAVADLHVVAEMLVGGRELVRPRVLAGDEHDVLAVVTLRGVGEVADPDARTLQVAEDGDRAGPSSLAVSRTSATVVACCSCVPCEKFRRATLRPASMRLRSVSRVAVDGPSVQTIFVRG